MSKSAMIRARVDPGLKRKAEEVFQKCGINATQAINLFYRQVELRQGIPFEIRAVPKGKQSKVADMSTNRLKAKLKPMSPNERLEAFFNHSQLMSQMKKPN